VSTRRRLAAVVITVKLGCEPETVIKRAAGDIACFDL
jgi:hypothetical protein